uniref:DUF2012 domain-containing protein n=1 Tax=Parastrongyloides trichosuri TaxID=131310 RepID=A0A0N4ZG65_PARTI
MYKLLLLFLLSSSIICKEEKETGVTSAEEKFKIQGKVILPPEAIVEEGWQSKINIHVDYGKKIGFIKSDGTFTIYNLPSGSYLIQVIHKDYDFEPVRVDITTKGKMRARRNILIQPNAVNLVPYPLEMIPRGRIVYFNARNDGFKITDVLFSPMVLMLVLPMALMYIMPKIVDKDPELKKEMENMQMPQVDMPDMSEMLSSWFGGEKPKKNSKKPGPRNR